MYILVGEGGDGLTEVIQITKLQRQRYHKKVAVQTEIFQWNKPPNLWRHGPIDIVLEGVQIMQLLQYAWLLWYGSRQSIWG